MQLAIAIGCAVILLLGFTGLTGAPYLPSKKRDIKNVFSTLYPLAGGDVLVDLGSGDGVVLRAASHRGARAVGYELGPVYWAVSRLLARGDKKQTIYLKSYWHVDFPPDTTVVFAFSDGRDIKKIHALVRAQAVRLGRPLAFITHGFGAPGVQPAATYGAYYLYTVNPLRQT